MFEPIDTFVRLVQCWNVPLAKAVTPFPTVTVARLEQLVKAKSPILEMVSGIISSVRVLVPAKAAVPIPVTIRPFVLLGIVTTPPSPVYFVMVMVLLLVVYVN